MKIEEAAMRLGLSENTLRTCFNRTKERLAKKGIIIIKSGRGEKAEYFIKVDGELLE